jgi:hypothetical protein
MASLIPNPIVRKTGTRRLSSARHCAALKETAMLFPLFRLTERRCRQIRRAAPRQVPPPLMRDVGLEQWRERPRMPFHLLW